MQKSKARPKLSELEGCVLGVVSRSGPCSAYRVRKEFRESLTTSWRGSAGAIYPLLERLVAKGFLKEKAIEADARGTRTLTITRNGRNTLAEWVGDSAQWLGEPAADPVRSRLQFLDQTPVRRRAAIERWIAETQAGMTRLKVARTQSLDPFSDAALLGSWYQLEARVKWLEELRRNLPET